MFVRSSQKRYPSTLQPTEMACLDYVPSIAIRPVDLQERLRSTKSHRKIRLLIGKCVSGGSRLS